MDLAAGIGLVLALLALVAPMTPQFQNGWIVGGLWLAVAIYAAVLATSNWPRIAEGVSAYPRLSTLIVGTYAFIAVAGLWQTKVLPFVSKKPPSLSPLTWAVLRTAPVPMVRIRYSSTQVVEISSAPGNYNEVLNLDNVATMRQADEATQDQIGMALFIESTSVTIDKPKGKPGYADGAGNVVRVVPGGETGAQFKNLTITGLGKKYVFDRFGASAHVVEVGQRRFRISLQSIRDKSNGKQKLLIYTFGISEGL